MAANNNPCQLCPRRDLVVVDCKICSKTYHKKCIRMGPSEYKKFKRERNWECPNCLQDGTEIAGKEIYTAAKNFQQEKACGIEKGLPGILFQLRLTEYLIMKSVELDLKFEIYKENKDFYPFDDIVFKYYNKEAENKAWNCLFIQVKHKQMINNDNFAITRESLTDCTGKGKSNGAFNLATYYKAYIKHKEAFSKCDGIINRLIVFTNASLHIDAQNLFQSCKDSILEESAIFNYCDDIGPINKAPDFLQVNPHYIDNICRTLNSETELGELARELIEAVLTEKKLSWENSLFKKYYQDLSKYEIIKIEHTNSGHYGRCSFGNFQTDHEIKEVQNFQQLLISIAWKIGMEFKNRQKFIVSNSKTIEADYKLLAKDVVHELEQLDNSKTDNTVHYLSHSAINTWIQTDRVRFTTWIQNKKRKHFVLVLPQVENQDDQFLPEVMREYFNIYVSDREIQVDEEFKIAFSPKNYKILARALLQKLCGQIGENCRSQKMDVDFNIVGLKRKFTVNMKMIANLVFKVENGFIVFADDILHLESSNKLKNEYVISFKEELEYLSKQNSLDLIQLSWRMNEIFTSDLVQHSLSNNLEGEFLQKFILAIDQPDEDQLEEISANCLRRKLGCERHESCDEFLYHFQKEIMKWVKSRSESCRNDEIVGKYIDDYLIKIASYRNEKKLVDKFKRLSI